MNENEKIEIDLIYAGINRFLSEGYNDWTKEKFKKLLSIAPDVNEDELLRVLKRKGLIEYVGKDDLYIRVLKEIDRDQ